MRSTFDGCINIYNCNFFLDWSLFHYAVSFFISCNRFYFKVYFYMSIFIPAFFWFPFAWNIFLYPLIFNLYVSLGLEWVSCMQQVYGSYFCIHTCSLYVLIGAFNSFTFEVIINMYGPISIFLIILGLILCVFFISCVSCLEKFFQHLL